MDVNDEFDRQRPRLRAVAYRILGSRGEAEDAVQEAWLRLQRTDAETIVDLQAWLTTTTARLCLNLLRARGTRGEQPLDDVVAEPIVSQDLESDPEAALLLADAVGIALQVVLETLTPAERLGFVLHDMFALPFDEIAATLGKSPAATRQLASRARRRVRDAAPPPDSDLPRQREVADAYFAATREGDIDGLIAVLHPDVVLRSHTPGGVIELRGAERVVEGAVSARAAAGDVRPALVNGAVGGVAYVAGRPTAILGFTVAGARIATVDVFVDPAVVARAVSGRSSPGRSEALRP